MLSDRFIHLGKKYSAIVTIVSLISSLSVSFNMPIVHAETTEPKDLLQFTSQNHILGFGNDGVYVASARHALTTKFLNAHTVMPISDDTTDADASGKVPALSKVTYENLWNGITAVYEAEKGSLMKSTYLVDVTKKGVSANSIRLRYNRPVQINTNGDLEITFDDGILTEKAPIAWQETPTGRHPIPVSFKLYRKNVVGFSLGEYLPNFPIIIDPSLTWNTFLGASGSDVIYAIAADSSGNVYVSGVSAATWGSPVRAYTLGTDGFVAKLDTNGTLLWNTFLGGSGTDFLTEIAVDTSGNVYTSGYSNATWGSPIRVYTSGYDGLAAKLDTNGTLLWNTFLGASGGDYAYRVAIDTSGNVYAGGYSDVTWGSPLNAYILGVDGFVTKLDSNGTLVWNTFLGGSGGDYVFAIAVGPSDNIYVGGRSNATWGSPVRAYTSGTDGFIAKFNSVGTLTWNTFQGGSGGDSTSRIAVDTSGNVYAGGYSPATWGSPVRSYSSGGDGFVAKVDSNGTLVWNTFLGTSSYDDVNAIAVDTSGNVFIGGLSNVTWGSPVRAYTSGTDGLAARLDSSGTLTWNTFLGGSGSEDVIYGISVDSTGNIYMGGYSNATWGSPGRAYTSGNDAIVVKMLDDTYSPTAAITYSSSGPYASGNAVTITATFSEAMADSPVPQISISGSETLAATDMTKVSTTVYTYALTVGAGNGTATVAMSTGTDAFSNVVTSAPTSGATFTVTNTVAAAESTETAAVIHRGGGRGLKSPGRGEDAPMIDFKTMQVISTTDTSPAHTSPSASPEQQTSHHSSPAILLLQNQRSKLLARIEKKIEAALTSAARKMLESNRERLLKRIDEKIQSLLRAI